jgi:Na+-driven multidrug efflux pump
MGIDGLCISSNITMFYCFIISSRYILISNPCPESLFLWSDEVLHYNEFISYFKLSIYSGIQHYGDYIGYEVVCFMCSYLTEVDMAATLIVLNYANVIGFIYVGFSFPLSHMVGYFMGERDFRLYELCVNIFLKINIITAVILGSFTFFFSDSISAIYIKDQETGSLQVRF